MSSFSTHTSTLVVVGAIDEAVVPEFQADLIHAVQRAADAAIVVDLTDVDYFPSSAIGAVVKAMRATGSTSDSMRLRAAESSVAQRVLHLCGLPHVVE